MPLSLYMYVYKYVQRICQKEFEKTNRLLAVKDIERLISDTDKEKAVRIFNSAIVDHRPVDGYPCYLTPPVAPLFYHDHFKRARIAGALAGWPGRLSAEASQEALAVLDDLCQSHYPGYLQIFAWNALGVWAALRPGIFAERRAGLLEAAAGSTGSLAGALVFLDKAALAKEDTARFLAEAQRRVRYKAQKALFGYYLIRNGHDFESFGASCAADGSLQEFFLRCRRKGILYPYDFEAGAREVGLLVSKEKGSVQDGTQQADIARQLKAVCHDYIAVTGFFLKTYWD